MKYYGFDDVRVVPVPSMVDSRDDVDTSVKLSDFLTLKVPIIASPMKGITSPEVVIEVWKNGGIGILHKFYLDSIKRSVDINRICNAIGRNFGIAVGLDDYMNWKSLVGYSSIICLDVANGYLDSVKMAVNDLKEFIVKHNAECLIMVGNVITRRGVQDLYDAGADLIRLGISTGQLCITGDVTGVSMPAISMLEQVTPIEKRICSSIDPAKMYPNIVTLEKPPLGSCPKFIMDGGIRNSGDIVKSLVAGANAVMVGSLFGKTLESDHDGIISGMASEAHQLEYYHTVRSVEGISKMVEKTTTIEKLMSELTWGIKSACTYTNSRNMKELRNNGKFIYLD